MLVKTISDFGRVQLPSPSSSLRGVALAGRAPARSGVGAGCVCHPCRHAYEGLSPSDPVALRRQNPWVLPTSVQMGDDLAMFDPPPWGFDVPCLGCIVRLSGCLRHLRPVGGGLGACWLPAVLPVRVSLVPGRLVGPCPVLRGPSASRRGAFLLSPPASAGWLWGCWLAFVSWRGRRFFSVTPPPGGAPPSNRPSGAKGGQERPGPRLLVGVACLSWAGQRVELVSDPVRRQPDPPGADVGREALSAASQSIPWSVPLPESRPIFSLFSGLLSRL